MNAIRLVYTVILSLSIVFSILLMIYAYKRQTMPGAKYFILILISTIIYNGAYIGEINSNKLVLAMFWYRLEHLSIPFQPYLWLMMSFDYVRAQKKYQRVAKWVMLYHPVLHLVIFFTNSIHHMYVSSYSFESNGYFPVITSSKGQLYLVVVVSGSLLGIMGTVLYARGYLKALRSHRHNYLVMTIASLFPWFTVYLYALNLNYMGIDYYPVMTIISASLFVLGIFRFKLFNTIPIATEIVFRQSKEGIMLIDLADRIIDVNEVLLKLYPEYSRLTSKSTLSAFIAKYPEFKGVFEKNEKYEYQLLIQGDERYYSAEVTKITTKDNLNIGKILSISDVTLFVNSQKRLELIASNAISKAETNEISFLQAQIKPHFINNTLSIIASMITREPIEAKNLIAELGEYLVNCFYFDNSTDMVELNKELETVNTYVTIEKARFRERLCYNLVCDEIPDIKVPRLIIQPLIENSIRHGILKKAEGGEVCLEIKLVNNKICFRIYDDGVGISQERISELLSGVYNQQGIGITNINKRLLRYYGKGLSITSVLGEGTTVVFSLPYDISG